MTLKDFHLRYAKWFYATATGIFAVIVGVSTGWPSVEPYWYASRGLMRVSIKEAQTPTQVALANVQISLAKTRQSAIDNDLLRLEIAIAKADDPAEKVRYQFQLRKLNNEYDDLERQVKAFQDSLHR